MNFTFQGSLYYATSVYKILKSFPGNDTVRKLNHLRRCITVRSRAGLVLISRKTKFLLLYLRNLRNYAIKLTHQSQQES